MAIATKVDAVVSSADQTLIRGTYPFPNGVVLAIQAIITGIGELPPILPVLLAPLVAPINLLLRSVLAGSKDPLVNVAVTVTTVVVVTVPIETMVDNSTIGLVQKTQEPV